MACNALVCLYSGKKQDWDGWLGTSRQPSHCVSRLRCNTDHMTWTIRISYMCLTATRLKFAEKNAFAKNSGLWLNILRWVHTVLSGALRWRYVLSPLRGATCFNRFGWVRFPQTNSVCQSANQIWCASQRTKYGLPVSLFAFSLLPVALRLLLWITAASEFKLLLLFGITSVLLTHACFGGIRIQ